MELTVFGEVELAFEAGGPGSRFHDWNLGGMLSAAFVFLWNHARLSEGVV